MPHTTLSPARLKNAPSVMMDPRLYRDPRYWYHPPPAPAPALYSAPWVNQYEAPRSKYPTLHPTLAVDTNPVRYDVRKPPPENLLPEPVRVISALSYSAPAIRIISRAFPWTLEIHAPVSCSAIYEGLYRMLQEPIVDSEWGIAVSDNARRETIERAARARSDKNKPLKRVYWLGERTMFVGLEKDEEFERRRLLPGMSPCPETWVAKFESRTAS